MALMVSISGIRGIVGKDINPLSLLNYTEAYINELNTNNRKILIGRDTRISGKSIKELVSSVITNLGFDIIDIGIAPTPTTLFAIRDLNCGGGIVITASHNPIIWNALKLCNNKGLFLSNNNIINIKKRAENINRSIQWVDVNNLGKIENRDDYGNIYIDKILSSFDTNKIKACNFKVVYDPVGGAASYLDRYFFESLNCKTIPINDRVTGYFPREPEPTPKNLTDLSRAVKKSNADVGFAQDPDADRLVIAQEDGKILSEEYTLLLSGDAYLRKNKTNIVCNLSTSMLMDKLAEKYGVSVIRTKIGEAYVTEKLLETNSGFGGEGNGGVIVPSINPARDSFVGMALILELMATTGKKISELVKSFPSYSMIKDKIKIKEDVSNKDNFYNDIEKKLLERFKGYDLIRIDGIKLVKNNQWIHVRLSNTEPQLRIVVESENEKQSKEIVSKIKEIIERN